MSPELQPITVQYYCHVSPSVSHEQYVHCHRRGFWSRATDVFLIYIHFGIILTQFYVDFSRQEHQINVL